MTLMRSPPLIGPAAVVLLALGMTTATSDDTPAQPRPNDAWRLESGPACGPSGAIGLGGAAFRCLLGQLGIAGHPGLVDRGNSDWSIVVGGAAPDVAAAGIDQLGRDLARDTALPKSAAVRNALLGEQP